MSEAMTQKPTRGQRIAARMVQEKGSGAVSNLYICGEHMLRTHGAKNCIQVLVFAARCRKRFSAELDKAYKAGVKAGRKER